ncbi:retrovirus-related Pol polyprotein from transposon opus [Trichonephila clavipes]|nr:retrovirus-related Pol polyprotein from transposon opus [Trichonephila clavipes]
MAEPSQHTSQLFLLDRKFGQKFLIDSGSEICVIPPSPTMNKPPLSNFSLFAANNTKIPAYGMVRKELNLGLRRPHTAQSTILLLLAHQSLPGLEGYTLNFRPVGDYRQLNSVTEFDSYPMPYLNDFAHALHGKRIFSKIDIFKAFHQIPIAECDIPKTAVTTPWGLYEYTHLYFGLVNAPQIFMRFMHEVRRTQSLLNWSSEATTAFQRCKQALADAALLAHPSPSAPLALHVDASDYAIGGALHQVVDSELQPLAFFSRKLTTSEKSCSAYDRELLAIYSAIRNFRYMLEARDFTVFTDHKPLPYTFRQKVTSVSHGRSVSWISSLSSPQILYTFQDLTILQLMFSLSCFCNHLPKSN